MLRVAVERHRADPDQRIILVRPHLGEVERVDPVGPGLGIGHHLHRYPLARMVTARDRLEQVAAMAVGIAARHVGGRTDALLFALKLLMRISYAVVCLTTTTIHPTLFSFLHSIP